MKRPHRRVNRLAIRRIMAAYTNASPLAHNLSKSLLILLLWSIQENVLSTTYARGEDSLQAGATCYALDFREFLHSPGPIP
jgi:hypothetical protein